MSRNRLFNYRRALRYIAIATGFAIFIGYLQQGSIGGGLALGFAVGIGVTIGLFGFAIATRY